MATAQVKKGNWVEDRVLGSGGFGAVVLWKNEETGEQIAIKRCRLQNEMTAKHKYRWKLEVDIMHRLDHENVIAARIVPPELDVGESEMPLLGMEYCSGGDLRKELNKPENCCGLKEFAIRRFVQDIASAVEYLHGKRIIHRDLKPENIVLQILEENKIVYKLIDLGYAKELDQGSVCTSFVGTLQYLAPELFASQKYTATVDYWSFGTVVFECITGYRPFLPNLRPIQWHKEVCKKSPEDICAQFDSEGGEVIFSKTILTPNNLCRSMQTYIENWLRLMLRWDPKQRGGGLKPGTQEGESRPQCFVMLDNILSMKIVYLLHVSNNMLLTYPTIEQHTMLDLQKRITEETKIPIEDQDIIMSTGLSPTPNQPASQCWMEPSEDECLVFLFKRGGEDFNQGSQRKFKPLPRNVQNIVREPTVMIPYQEQKRAWAEAVYYCYEQAQDLKRLILSQRAAMLSLLRTDSTFVKAKTQMMHERDKLLAKIDFFEESHQHDINLYKEQANNDGIVSEMIFRKWQKKNEEVQSFKQLDHQVTDLDQYSNGLRTKIVELQRSPFARAKQDDTLEDYAKKAREEYQDFRQASKDVKDNRNHKPIVNIVVKCISYRDRKLNDLFAHLGKIGTCKEQLRQLLPQLEQCRMSIQAACTSLVKYQQERQSDIWKFVKVAVNEGLKNPRPEKLGNHVTDMRTSSHSNSSIVSTFSESSYESVRIMEDSRQTSKMFEEMMHTMIQQQEDFTSLVSSLAIGTQPT
ncbi:hypothetical protein ACJMK2_035111 [Sinanodonta woodiana]|uniref:IkappaB kinase n=1 Tax=Sinanodonta woodiana TaxID=1069815 RepID=A0ABD3WTT8_SINWO